MKYHLLILGLLFLFNPEVTIFDLLPDFIGFLLIAKALAPLAPLSPSAESAVEKFRKLAAISGIKVVAILPMMSLSSTEPEITMVFTAAFAILSAIYLFPAFSDLFASISYFAERYQTQVKGTSFVKPFTYVSFLLRYGLAFFPETVYLNVDETMSEIYQTPVYPWEPFRTGITVLAVSLSLIIGIVWLIVVLIYVGRLKKNHMLNDGIARDRTSASVPFGKVLLSSTKPALLLLTFSAFAVIAFHIDGVPLLPAAVCPLLILVAVLYVKRPLGLSNRCWILPAASFAFGIYSHFSVMSFCEAHHDRATIEFAPYQQAFLKPFVTETIASLLQAACFLFCVMPLVRKLIVSQRTEPSGTVPMTIGSSDKREQFRLSFLCIAMTIFAVLYGVAKSISYWFFYRYHGGRFLVTTVGLAFGLLAWYLFSGLRQRLEDVHQNS